MHARDKAQHKTDMIERLPDLANVFSQGGIPTDLRDQINRMAHGPDIVDMVFYDLSGARIPMSDTLWDPVVGMDHSNHQMDMADAPADHEDHDDHGAPDLAMLDAPDRLDNSVLRGTPTMEENTGSVAAKAGSSLVTAIISIYDQSDEQLGYGRYVVVVNDVMAAYSSGLTRFASVLVLFGIAIFGVPAFGYVLQRRIADRFNSDGNIWQASIH
ncbi:hypothetical protein [Pseudooctadecabacter sp.]|uniref:hypothetical protein n=1 Tax=Pseudooctadecabacter sp. TaxID=1966338 RepID=UPI003F6D6030